MALFNEYEPTYKPNYQQGNDQQNLPGSPGNSPLFSNGQFPDYMQAAFASGMTPRQMDSQGRGGGSIGPQSQPGVSSIPANAPSAIGVNMNPNSTQAWADPTATQIGTVQTNHGQTGNNSVMNQVTGGNWGIWTGAGNPGSTTYQPNYQYSWNNPLQPVQDVLTGTQGLKTPTGSSNGVRIDARPGLGGGPQNLWNYNSGAQLTPWDLGNAISGLNYNSLQSINPYAMQSAFSQSAQNFANAWANPNFQGGYTSATSLNPGYTLQGMNAQNSNSGATQANYQSWMQDAYHNYIQSMNQNHLF